VIVGVALFCPFVLVFVGASLLIPEFLLDVTAVAGGHIRETYNLRPLLAQVQTF
jgi:hypothetical protein